MSMLLSHPLGLLAWILISLFIGFLCRNRRRVGFVGGFLASFLLTPLVGLLLLMVSVPQPRRLEP